MITGYDVGTKVKWNQNNGLQTGVVLKVYRDFEDQDGATRESMESNPLNYLILRSSGGYIVLSHHDVMLKKTNSHT